MTKTLRNILISILGMFAFLFAGFFFVGCRVDYSKITLSADKTSISLEVGQSAELVLTIENYQSGFDNRLQIDPLSDGETAIFTVDNQKVISENQVKVTITGAAGGHGYLHAKTLEASKECSVEVSVTQYSTTLNSNKSVLYLSNATNFVPTPNLFEFDPHTTNEKLSYYLLKPKADINFNTFSLSDLDISTSTAYFSDGTGVLITGSVAKFDKVSLLEDSIKFENEGQEFDEPLVNKFLMLSVYDFSVDNENYEKILYSVDEVNVLPSLNVKISGGYINPNTGYVDFAELDDNPIKIVPNNKNMLQYILKFEMINSIVDAPLNISQWQSNEYVVVDLFEYTEEDDEKIDGAVYYWKISQNSLVQSTTDLSLRVFYDIAKNIDDESVNIKKNINISLEIAPTGITVNGTNEPARLTLYNYYKFPEFGWNELLFDVISGLESSPNFDGIYFTYDDDFLDLMYDGETVNIGSNKLYTNLAMPFYVRGKYGVRQVNTTLNVHLVSGILENAEEIVLTIDCSIIAGATQLTLAENYQNNKYFYLDRLAGKQSFDSHVYADQKFQFMTYTLISGTDVLDIDVHNENPCLQEAGRYYLNLSLTPKATGIGIYSIYLDNGMYVALSFNVINTLQSESSRIVLTNDGNEAVTNSFITRDENSDFDNVLELEILNPSTKDSITFGNTATLRVEANTLADGVKFLPNDVRYVSITKVADIFKITTLANGNTNISFTLTGYDIDDFSTKQKELKFVVKVSSYSLVNEYHLENSGGYAFNNVVYYGGGLSDEDEAVFAKFDAVALRADSSNFYQYFFVEKSFVDVFANAVEGSEAGTYSYNLSDNQVQTRLIKERYNQKFIYFLAHSMSGDVFSPTSTKVEVTKSYVLEGEEESETKTIYLTFEKGLMFYADDFVYIETDEIGATVASYSVKFSNVYSIGVYGSFNMTNFSFKRALPQSFGFVLKSYLEQRKNTMPYFANIYSRPYQSVENISLSSSLTELSFSNNNLTYTLTVYTYPTNTTNKDIYVEFVRTNGNPYANMLTYKIDYSQKENGIYSIELSCENFYEEHLDDIVDIREYLTGLLYIYPSEWGDSYTSINGALRPICLDVQYRNGSKANPYLLQTAEDIANINSNEVTLRSHYEINTVIDLSTLKNFTPIGILNGEVVGFSGTIVGTNSQASVTNVNITKDDFTKLVENTLYCGLFAKINSYKDGQEASLENLTVSGSISADFSGFTYNTAKVGILTAENDAKLVNVAVRVSKSSISTKEGTIVYFGGVAGENSGEILQDFTQYDLEGKYTAQNSKILAYYNDFVEITSNKSTLYAGGIAGVTFRVIKRTVSENLKMYGYTSYTAYTLIKVSGYKSSANPNIYVGGAAGAIFVEDEKSANIENLLIGGEVDTSACNDITDSVGGIVGVADTKGNSKIQIHKNTSRVFLRGLVNVGTICGSDIYSNKFGSNLMTDFGKENISEAVDDGRNTFYSAQVIRYKDVTSAPTTGNDTFYAIGNQTTSGRNYEDFAFENYSYLLRKQILTDSVITNGSSTNDFYGDYIILDKTNLSKQYTYTHKDVTIGLGKTGYEIPGDETQDVYFMYYFGVQGVISGDSDGNCQDKVDALNYHIAGSTFYPISITSQDVNILSSTSDKLAVDVNGNLTAKGTGLTTITLSSILNQVVNRNIYILIVNYFDKDVKASLFYTSPSMNGVNISDQSTVNIYGNSSSNIYLVPSYNLDETHTYLGEKDSFRISEEGVLSYRNVDYRLSKNTQIGVETTQEYEKNEDGSIKTDENGQPIEVPRFSVVQPNKQTIIFTKDKKTNPSENDVDNYTLTPVLEIIIGGQTYRLVLEASKIDLQVKYKERATAINVVNTFVRIPANNEYSDTVNVVSTNKDEMLFYEIFDDTGALVQSRMPSNVDEVENWSEFINKIDEKDLFNLKFAKGKDNAFTYTCAVNTSSERFLNRFNKNIYGRYIVRLYANELTNGVEGYFEIQLDEAQVANVSVNNYSDFSELAQPDEIVVPSQTGLLEIAIDPVEAVFDKVSVSNNIINSLDGATNASFTFVYEKVSEEGVKYIENKNFAQRENGEFFFTYKDLLDFYKEVNEKEEKEVVSYTGKVFVAYYMPSTSVDNGVKVAFDVVVSYSGEQQIVVPVSLTTKLSSFAKLTFDNKQEVDGKVFVARGLSYDLTLNLYGYTEDQVQFDISDKDFASLSGENGKYKLQISSDRPHYNNDIGYCVTITTTATKEVDGKEIPTRDVLTVYIMEYVMNYTYVEGVNEDIVDGMQNGIVYTAIGNPFELNFSISTFLEYDSTNGDVVSEVQNFVANMTNNIEWAVYFDKKVEILESGKSFRDEKNYFLIDSFTVTPLRIYDPTSEIYHFSARGNYKVFEGEYSYSAISINAEQIYTEFSFEVHEQSTNESPIPVDNYEDFLNMKDDEWYILTADIDLVGSEKAQVTGQQEFSPITASIAGLDGNGYKLRLSGSYNLSNLSEVGVFTSVAEGAVIKNVTIQLLSDTVFKLNTSAFNVGLLTASNAGVITNCKAVSENGCTFSVTSAVMATSSYVAGLVANNAGQITNSQSMVNIFANVNLSGFVGQNSGIIASSYFYGASLSNKNSDRTSSVKTAGFAVLNSGNIYTSYVSGVQKVDSIFYDGTENSIVSSNNITGFVYSNSGNVEDCYSNIRLTQSGAYASGFAIDNSGVIERCISTSVLSGNKSDSFAFVMTNDSATYANAKVSDCFYLSDIEQNVNVGVEKNKDDNVSVIELAVNDFKNRDNLEKYFKNFVVAEGRNINSVWFYNDNQSDLSNFNGSIFGCERLELVAPNIIASSRRILDGIEEVTNSQTGVTYNVYKYIYDKNYPALGSMYNPILIANAEDMETYIPQETNSAGYNYSYYRLISNIDYSEYIYNSGLYKTKFMGYLEGNFMSISGVSIIASESLTFAGMFAEIGSRSIDGAVGTVMNFSLSPSRVSFSNANVVGAIAGKLDNGNVINVDVLLPSSDSVVATGNNIVGGAIGLGLGNYKIQNLYSQISAKARNQDISNSNGNTFNSNTLSYGSYSFAGSVAGVLSGEGYVYNCITDSQISVLADKAGLMFGLIDGGVTLEKVYLQMSSDMLVNTYSFGGLVAGESKGFVGDVNIVGTGGYFENFKKSPFAPEAVGGFAGLVSGGEISGITMTQSINISSANEVSGISNLGGIAGELSAAAIISDVTVKASFIGFEHIGGVVGLANHTAGIAHFKNISVTANMQILGHKMFETSMGGLVGKTTSTISLQAAESNVSVSATIYVYEAGIKNYIGGVIGQDSSITSHQISDTTSILTTPEESGVTVYDMSITGGNISENLSVKDVTSEDKLEKQYELESDRKADTENPPFITHIKENASKCKFYCNITFSKPENSSSEGAGYDLIVTLYGNEYIPNN